MDSRMTRMLGIELRPPLVPLILAFSAGRLEDRSDSITTCSGSAACGSLVGLLVLGPAMESAYRVLRGMLAAVDSRILLGNELRLPLVSLMLALSCIWMLSTGRVEGRSN